MAKALMGKARFKIQRRLGTELPGLGKPGALERRPYPPGQHGMKRKKLSEYTIRLMEKQKVLFHYGLRENQLLRAVKKAKKDRSQDWVDTLVQGLELRLDNVVFRLGFAPSMAAARQMVRHGHIMVNGTKKSIPSESVKIGDKIRLKDGSAKHQNYLQTTKSPRLEVPAYLEKSPVGEVEEGLVKAKPLADDIPFPFEKRYVTEFYWKIK